MNSRKCSNDCSDYFLAVLSKKKKSPEFQSQALIVIQNLINFYLCHLKVLPLYMGVSVIVQDALSPFTLNSINFGFLME
jgi:hypothetical protein